MEKKPFEELIVSSGDKIPYSGDTVCFCMTQYAKDYVKARESITNTINKDVRDAVIVDAINYMGTSCGMDFCLYTCDLYEDKKHLQMVEPNTLLTVMLNHCSGYIYRGIPKSVIRNSHMNKLQENQEVSDEDCIATLVDFLNFIARENNIDKNFTAEELIQRKQILKERAKVLKKSRFRKKDAN
jgi:hypothetical protein